MTTTEQKIKELTAQIEAPPDRNPLVRERSILEMLPREIEAPCISNDTPHDNKMEPTAWLSFSDGSYGRGNYDPVAILAALEEAGWKTAPCTLVAADNYRACPHPIWQNNVPQTWERYTTKDYWPLCPLWVEPSQHMKPECRCFMIAPNGEVMKITLDIPASVSVHAERKTNGYDWYFVRGTARLSHPDHWHNPQIEGRTIAQKHVKSFASVDTEQGVSGAIYWEPVDHGQDDFPYSARQMLEILLSK